MSLRKLRRRLFGHITVEASVVWLAMAVATILGVISTQVVVIVAAAWTGGWVSKTLYETPQGRWVRAWVVWRRRAAWRWAASLWRRAGAGA